VGMDVTKDHHGSGAIAHGKFGLDSGEVAFLRRWGGEEFSSRCLFAQVLTASATFRPENTPFQPTSLVPSFASEILGVHRHWHTKVAAAI
jgi:hypothetical protein